MHGDKELWVGGRKKKMYAATAAQVTGDRGAGRKHAGMEWGTPGMSAAPRHERKTSSSLSSSSFSSSYLPL